MTAASVAPRLKSVKCTSKPSVNGMAGLTNGGNIFFALELVSLFVIITGMITSALALAHFLNGFTMKPITFLNFVVQTQRHDNLGI